MRSKAELYRERAAQMRSLAQKEEDFTLKQKLEAIALEYEAWADRLEPLKTG